MEKPFKIWVDFVVRNAFFMSRWNFYICEFKSHYKCDFLQKEPHFKNFKALRCAKRIIFWYEFWTFLGLSIIGIVAVKVLDFLQRSKCFLKANIKDFVVQNTLFLLRLDEVYLWTKCLLVVPDLQGQVPIWILVSFLVENRHYRRTIKWVSGCIWKSFLKVEEFVVPNALFSCRGEIST